MHAVTSNDKSTTKYKFLYKRAFNTKIKIKLLKVRNKDEIKFKWKMKTTRR